MSIHYDASPILQDSLALELSKIISILSKHLDSFKEANIDILNSLPGYVQLAALPITLITLPMPFIYETLRQLFLFYYQNLLIVFNNQIYFTTSDLKGVDQ